MSLSDIKIKTAKPGEQIYKLYDSSGLYIEIPPSGKKRWRFKYRFDDKEKRISLGVYPDVSLKDARDRRDEARRIVSSGEDPSVIRRRQTSVASDVDSFRKVAEEWIENRKSGWSESHRTSMEQRLIAYIYPEIGDKPITELNVALRTMGFSKEQMTSHGFRAMASTLLNEMGWSPDVIERQLAHTDKNKIRGAYNRAEYMDDRRAMMQAWADFLDEIATSHQAMP